MSDTLRISLLGGLRISTDEMPIEGFTSAKTLALLCYLATTGRPHLRGSLAALLWGSMPEERAMGSLRRSLHNLRQLVPDYLYASRREVAFRHDKPYWLDVEVFTSAVEGVPLASVSPRVLAAALDLYEGDFLAGFSLRDAPEFEEWMIMQGERLRQMALHGFSVLAAKCTDEGDYDAAIRYSGRLLQIEPWQEEGHRQMMTVLALSGRRSAALTQYETFRRMLADELGDEPSPETAQLAEQIRAGTLARLRIETRQPKPIVSQVESHPKPSLPAALTSLIGREREVEAICDLLARPGTRLVTLTGPGGTGKTRLALAVADSLESSFTDNAAFVSLDAVREPDLVASTIASGLGIREAADEPLLDVLKTYLRTKNLLLVLDNFEQIIEAASLVTELLSTAPGLTVLVTSRERLHVYGEHEFPVPPLSLSDAGEDKPVAKIVQSPAVRLFIERARATRYDFALRDEDVPNLAAICRHLDGLPLAIELAAARVRDFSPLDLLMNLSRARLRMLEDGPRDTVPRQRTLRDTIAWSYNLLIPDQQRLFYRLAVFADGWTQDGAAVVCSPATSVEALQGLTSLVDKNLLRRDGMVRFRMLETIRQYAEERLEASGEADALRQRHAEYYLALTEAAEPQLTGADQVMWLNRLETELNNLRAALGWLLDREQGELALRMTGALQRFWDHHSHFEEGRRWLEAALTQGEGAPAGVRASALLAAGVLSVEQSDYEHGETFLEKSLALYRKLEDGYGTAFSLNALGTIAYCSGEYDWAKVHFEDAMVLLREVGDRDGIAALLAQIGYTALLEHNYDQAVERFEESLELYRQLGSELGSGRVLNLLGRALLEQGDHARAKALFREGLQLHSKVGNRSYIAECLEGLAASAQAERAARLWGAAEALRAGISIPIPAVDRPYIERHIESKRALLDEGSWRSAWKEGGTMPLEQVISRALEGVDAS